LFRVRSPGFIDRDTCGRRDTAHVEPRSDRLTPTRGRRRQFCHCLRQASWTDAPLRQPRAGGRAEKRERHRRGQRCGAAEAAKVRMGDEPVRLMDEDDSFAHARGEDGDD
jgi:hypothetical protein